MIIIDIEQGSEQWLNEKIGKPSASNASKIITNAGAKSKQQEGYMFELVGEIITGKKEDGYRNKNMETGNEREYESREFFEIVHNVEVSQVGVVYKDEKKEFLCSPDGLVDNKYGIELKNVLPKTQVKYLLNNKVPSEYFSQIQFSLYITGLEYWYFMSYVPAMKPLIIKVERDEKFLKLLDAELKDFCEELKETVNKIK